MNYELCGAVARFTDRTSRGPGFKIQWDYIFFQYLNSSVVVRQCYRIFLTIFFLTSVLLPGTYTRVKKYRNKKKQNKTKQKKNPVKHASKIFPHFSKKKKKTKNDDNNK